LYRCPPRHPNPRCRIVPDSAECGHPIGDPAQRRIAEIDTDRHHIAAEPGDLHILPQRIEAGVVEAWIDPRRDRAERRTKASLIEPRLENRVLSAVKPATADALVWALTELMVRPMSSFGI
jgi:hypothetical protein